VNKHAESVEERKICH